jgi:GNAT superfamily N-acetyltransferase
LPPSVFQPPVVSRRIRVSLDIVSVRSSRDLRRFIDLPWRVYDKERHPQWVPPLRFLVKEALDDRRNRFYDQASRELFIAVRNGMPVGRIAAIENRAHNDFHGDRIGFFGFFEAQEDQEAATALVGAAGDWLRARGLDAIRGPVSPSTNHECGLLVRGFRWQPTFLTPWNPRYYAALLEGAGLRGVKDLLAYFIPMNDDRFALPEKFAEHARRAVGEQRVEFRDLDLRRWKQEIDLCWEVYNAAWEPNWGFVPMPRPEFQQMAEGLKYLLVPQFAFAAEVDGQPAGFCLVVPDFNHVLEHNPSGRLFPTGLLKLLIGKGRLKSGRIMALGVKREFRTAGIFALFADELFRRGRAYGAVGAEASWILEDNELMNRPLRAIGAKEYRRWRMYEAPLAG